MSSCILKDLSIYEKYVSLECKPLSKICVNTLEYLNAMRPYIVYKHGNKGNNFV